MLTLAQFRTYYPEFSKVPDDLVQGALDRAALDIDLTVWGDRQDVGHGLKAAHILAISPMGVMARMVAKDGSTTYHTLYQDEIVIVAGMILRVV